MSKAYALLYEINHQNYNPFNNIYEGIVKKPPHKEIDHGDWVERHEVWALDDNPDTEMQSAYNPSGDYIGTVDDAKRLIKKGIIKFEKIDPSHSVCSIGFNPVENKWFGWSHRAIAGFGVGDKCKLGDAGYVPANADEFIKELKTRYNDSEIKKNHRHSNGELGALVIGKTLSHFEPYPLWGKGQWIAKNLQDAKAMAIDFASGVS